MENRLQVYQHPDDISALQGKRRPRGSRFDLFQTNWAPTTRLLASAVGGALIAFGMRRRDRVGALVGLAGAGLATRAITNIELKRLVGVNVGPRAVDVHKTINIKAPVNYVFDFWHNLERFPLFMSHLPVRYLGDGRYHWSMSGPFSLPVEWDTTINELMPNRIVTWQTVPGASVPSAGVIHLRPTRTARPSSTSGCPTARRAERWGTLSPQLSASTRSMRWMSNFAQVPHRGRPYDRPQTHGDLGGRDERAGDRREPIERPRSH